MHANESALAAHLPWLSTLQVGSAAGLSRDVHEYIDKPDVAAPLTATVLRVCVRACVLTTEFQRGSCLLVGSLW